MNIDSPAAAQFNALRALWKEAFGDSDEFLDIFFSTAFSRERCRCLTLNGDVAAALYWFDTQCRGQKTAYLYAIATGSSHRRRGYCRMLMEKTHAHLKDLGYAGAILVPQTPQLARYYEKLGYTPATSVSEFTARAADTPVSLRRIDAAEYARLRRAALPAGGVIQEGENLAFLSQCAAFYAGSDFLLAAQPTPDGVFIPELLGSAQAAPGILSALGLCRGTFRTPGAGRTFAMFHPLSPDAAAPAYFGLAFD